MEDEDPELAEEIKKRMFIFEDIIMFDDRAIQKIMGEVDSQELAKALKNVDSEIQNKIFKNMSKRAAALFKEDMDYMGPVRLHDVEEAQAKIVSIIRHLEDQGEITIPTAGDEIIEVEPFFKKDELEKELPLERNQYLLNHANQKVLKDIDDETIALAVYGIAKDVRHYILSYLNIFRRIKVKRILNKLQQVWMNQVKIAQNEIVEKIQCVNAEVVASE